MPFFHLCETLFILMSWRQSKATLAKSTLITFLQIAACNFPYRMGRRVGPCEQFGPVWMMVKETHLLTPTENVRCHYTGNTEIARQFDRIFTGLHNVKYTKFFSTQHSAHDSKIKNIQGAPIKSNPLEKILYLWNCSRFFTRFMLFTEEDLGHVSSKLHLNIWFDSRIITVWT